MASSDKVPSRIYPYLFLGSHGEARNKSRLKELHITHVVSIGHGLRAAFARTRYINIIVVTASYYAMMVMMCLAATS